MAPVFLIGAGAYIYWRSVGFWTAASALPQNACICELAEVMEPRGTADR